jgi:replicative DNA helicase
VSDPKPSALSALGRAALWYAEHLGWRVFPLHDADASGCSCGGADCMSWGKHPRTQRGCLDATTAPDTIRGWWTRWPSANVGVATGGGLVVVDIDPRHGGDEAFDEMRAKFGAAPDTVEALTGGGGRHIYLAVPEGAQVRNSAGLLGVGLDVRGEGGYVVAPPSVHGSGKAYAWEASSRPGEVTVATVPSAWLVSMTARPRLRLLAGGAAGEAIPEGKRNETLFRRASSMRASGFERDAILAAVAMENETRCSPPVDPAEVKALVESVCRYPAGLSPEFERERVAAELRRAEESGRLDIERILIATLLHDNAKHDSVLDRLFAVVRPGEFENPRHAAIYSTAVTIDRRGAVVTRASVVDDLRAMKRIGAAGGEEYIARLLTITPEPDHVEDYGKRIAERAHLRELRDALGQATLELAAPTDAPMKAVEAARARLAVVPDGVRGGRDDTMEAHASEAYTKAFTAMNDRKRGQQKCARWGIAALDGTRGTGVEDVGWYGGALGGLFGKKLYLLGGEPGAGKTSCAWSALLATARGDEHTPGRPCIAFSLEMDGPELNLRLAGQMCGIGEEKIEQGAITATEFARLQRALAELGMLPIKIISDCDTVESIAARVHAEKARGDVALVVVDYMQLLKLPPNMRDENRAEAERVQALKRLATRADVPLLVVTSMTKAAQKSARDGKVSSGDARGSGSEFAADVIAFLIRTNPDDDSGRPEVTFYMTKRRGGPASRPTLIFDMPRGVFETKPSSEEGQNEAPARRPKPQRARPRPAFVRPIGGTGDEPEIVNE